MARAGGGADAPGVGDPARPRFAHPFKLQLGQELRLVSRVELVEADPDHDQPDDPDKELAERWLVGHRARRHGVFRAVFSTQDGLRSDKG